MAARNESVSEEPAPEEEPVSEEPAPEEEPVSEEPAPEEETGADEAIGEEPGRSELTPLRRAVREARGVEDPSGRWVELVLGPRRRPPDDRVVVFHHIRKTAGTSLKDTIKRNVPK